MRSKELSIELPDRLVSRHRSGEVYQNIAAALQVPKSTVDSIILKCKKFGTTKTLPRAGPPAKLSNRGRRALDSEVTKNPMDTNKAPECLCGDGRTLQMDNQSGLYGSVARWKPKGT
jgi:transposase